MLGMVALMLLQARNLSKYVKENIAITVYIKDGVKEADIKRLQKSLDAAIFTRLTEYIDNESAAIRLRDELGEDFIEFLGYNPLSTSIDIYLNQSHANPDSVSIIEADLIQNPKVKEVYYRRDLLSFVNENVQKISLLLSGFSLLLLIVAIALINSTIRLSIYSKRFLIRSMQLVGATQSFIRKPFIIQGLINGLYGSIIASLLLTLVIYYAQKVAPEIISQGDILLFAGLFGFVVFLGLIISWISTALAVRRYLRLKTDQLYLK
jgi:cell division transport system permease protein